MRIESQIYLCMTMVSENKNTNFNYKWPKYLFPTIHLYTIHSVQICGIRFNIVL